MGKKNQRYISQPASLQLVGLNCSAQWHQQNIRCTEELRHEQRISIVRLKKLLTKSKPTHCSSSWSKAAGNTERIDHSPFFFNLVHAISLNKWHASVAFGVKAFNQKLAANLSPGPTDKQAMKTWYKIHKHPESLQATKKTKDRCGPEIFPNSWTCVGIRGPSWTCVGIRGPSWACVGFRGHSWGAPVHSWRFVGDSWRFVGFKHCQACVVYNIRAESWQFVLGSGGTARNRGEMQGPNHSEPHTTFQVFRATQSKNRKSCGPKQLLWHFCVSPLERHTENKNLLRNYFTLSHPHHNIYTFCYWQNFWHSIWHIFWQSFWHIFWHSTWHTFWHSIWQIFWHICWHPIWHSIWQIFWHSIWQTFRHFIWHNTFWHSIWHSIWHTFWHSIWHIFWHSIWHIFWHIFWHSIWHISWHFI